jgi:hypothetical protein
MDSCKCGDDLEKPMSLEVDEEDESFVWDFEILNFLKNEKIRLVVGNIISTWRFRLKRHLIHDNKIKIINTTLSIEYMNESNLKLLNMKLLYLKLLIDLLCKFIFHVTKKMTTCVLPQSSCSSPLVFFSIYYYKCFILVEISLQFCL